MGGVVLGAVSCVASMFVCLWLFFLGLSLLTRVEKEFFRIHKLLLEEVLYLIKRHKVVTTGIVFVLLASVVVSGLSMR
jgi:hypothetical protein